MLAPVRTVAPAITPVSLAEAKQHLRVDHSDDDALITALIAAAVDHLDGWTGILGRCLVEQTWRQDFERFASCLPLPLGPVIGIVSVMSDAGSVDQASYSLVTDAGGRARVEFASGVSVAGPVSVTYEAGYPTTPEQPGSPVVPEKSTVPDGLKLAIVLHVKMNYETMEPAARDSYQRAFDALIAPYRRISV
ncbi:phage head-tail connector protein [Rhizobium sp. ARZ01]|uniref:head-tail connector protein n=1 Tax=Rhizobium sp. ARZ01 TaxID=2769313 RepID=UPI00177B7581|nr:head-tail connector protein [Rhizobium sp. ARZ01]MBD9372109.1 phage head-tail connector protein [Rhizobium sp. ARZ01]